MNQSVSADKCYVIVPCRRATFQHEVFQLTGSLEGPVMSPAATCRGKRHLQSCRALAWHEAGTAQQEIAHNPLGRETSVYFLFFFFFWRGLGVFLGSGHPQSSRMYNRKLANHSRHQGMPLDNAVSLGWPTGFGKHMRA